MKKSIFAFVLGCCAIGSWAQQTESLDSCIIEGRVSDVADGVNVLLYRHEGRMSPLVDSTKVKNGHFRLAVMPLTENQKLLIHTSMDQMDFQFFWVNPGKHTTITGKGNAAVDWHIENNSLCQKEANAIIAFQREKMPRALEAQKEIYSLYPIMDDPNISQEKKKEVGNKGRALSKERDSIKAAHVEEYIDFLADRPYTPAFLEELVEIAFVVKGVDNKAVVEKAHDLYTRIPAKYQSEPDAIQIRSMFFPNAIAKGGKIADFTLYDRKGNEHHLNEFAGKYVLLEFSGKGCPPCEAAKPLLNEIYSKYSDKLEIITVSIDATKHWMESIDDKVTWHEWNDKKQAAEIKAKYGVLGIPHFFFVSPEGNIIDQCSGYGDGFKQKLAEVFPFIK